MSRKWDLTHQYFLLQDGLPSRIFLYDTVLLSPQPPQADKSYEESSRHSCLWTDAHSYISPDTWEPIEMQWTHMP